MATHFNEIDSFDAYELYNKDIENFFLKNYISKKAYHKGEKFDQPRQNTILYIHKGYGKIYTVNKDGIERFHGFMPQYSLIFQSPGVSLLNKYTIAATNTDVYCASLNEYLSFLQSSPDLILYQIHEPYYRRNFNELPLLESQNQNSKTKLYIYLRYLAMRFGKPVNEAHPKTIVINNAPTLKDIAHYNDIHPNNVVTFFNELKRQGVVSKVKDKLTIHDIDLLEAEIEKFKK